MGETVNKVLIANIKVPANEMREWAVPKGCVRFVLQCREAKSVKISIMPDMEVYFTLKSGKAWEEDNLDIKVRLPLFFNPGGNNVTMEALLGIQEVE